MSTEINVKYEENKGKIMLEFQKPTLRYLNEFVKLTCAPDLLALKLFPNAKEVTESMAAFNAMRKNLLLQEGYDLRLDNIACVVVGDGCTPRTGALFAFRTNWQVYSVDPRLRVVGKPTIKDGWYLPRVERLTICPVKGEDFRFQMPIYKKVLIVAVHSHAPLQKVVENIRQQCYNIDVDVISIPCCYQDNLEVDGFYKEPGISYLDWGVHSEKRRINIYKSV